ncbi:MAG: MATE family efflux transporter [Candidatus Fermentibacteraceae bacterium]
MKHSASLDMTRGSVTGKLLRLAWPVMAAHLLQTLYNLADAFWLGKLGRQSLVAPTISMNVVFIAMALAMGLGSAGTTLVSQFRGAGRDDLARRAGGQTFLILSVIGLILGVIGLVFAPAILRLLNTPQDAFSETQTYLTWILAGLPLMFPFFVYQGISTGLGNTVGPLQVSLVTVILNALLDPLLIFGAGPIPALGVTGAAAATVFCHSLASVIGTVRLFRGHSGFRLTAASLRPEAKTISRLLSIGLPVSLGQAGTSLGFTVLLGIVNSFGSAVTAAFGVGNRIIHLALVPAMGLSQANAAAVGQCLGAGLPARAAKSTYRALLVIGLLLLPITVPMFFLGGAISGLFVNDPAVMEVSRNMFRITTPSVYAFGFVTVLFGSFQGSGFTLPVMVLNMARLWVMRIPLAYYLAFHTTMGMDGLWWAMFVSNVLTALAGGVWFAAGTWKTRSSKILASSTLASEVALE